MDKVNLWWSRPSTVTRPLSTGLSLVCCVCGDHISGPVPTEAMWNARRISHGYCPECYTEAMSHIREVGA